MSNRFVSGGTINPTDSSPDAKEAAPREQLAKNAEWEAVQAELENDRKRREAERLKAATGEERSLYDVLQANKAAKQAAFEEANKIRNQFRALDDDEVEFLDEVVAAKRKEEERVRRETEDGVKSFRERQRRTSGEGVVEEDKEEDWGVGRKRKRRDRDKEKGVVKKKVDDRVHTVEIEKSSEKEEPAVKVPEKKSALVDYGSDSDE
ncbi:NEFA-interacting nuclear protein NIP30 [Pochonia chlamydosporia 170]|uniref:NEFA-interacting nuclear protein NIP30 n=1 Tax=Pochonia chlamydosporia 170 TaxID=1380566 RepID=A0A179G4V1_METCM|nr:NEFA-interacting nuclear protein NIP30 [Pochonia chlamydosporia 170]OAQ72872.1 NEFA-interacting nuclear protein NIP30 [Pochonia chlamydosporia 170]